MTSSGPPGLFADMDGTLANSLAVLRTVHRRFLADFGIEATDASFDAVNGLRLRVAVERMQADFDLPGEVDDLLARFVAGIGEAYDEVPPMDGARELLERARAGGVKVAVVTSASPELAHDWLERTGLRPLADAVVTGADVTRGKPDPEPFRAAVERVGADPARSVAVEDSRTGARSAVAAGLVTWVFAPHGDFEAREGWPAVAGCVARLADLPLPGEEGWAGRGAGVD